jgi:hypothetical protein
MSLYLDPAQKNIMGLSQKIIKFTCFLVKNQGGKNMGVKRRNLLVKRILLSFPQFLSVGVFILHEVPQCTQAGFDFF